MLLLTSKESFLPKRIDLENARITTRWVRVASVSRKAVYSPNSVQAYRYSRRASKDAFISTYYYYPSTGITRLAPSHFREVVGWPGSMPPNPITLYS